MKIIRNQSVIIYNEAKIVEGIETTGQTINKNIGTVPSIQRQGPIIMKND